MKNAACCFFVLCAGVFGQTNAAGDAIQKRVKGMNLLTPPVYHNAYVFPPASKICAIPLLRATGPGTNDKMPVVRPKTEALRGDLVSVPAPACDEATFTNK
jgi:hypothetical protein